MHAAEETTARHLSDSTSKKPTSVFTNALGLVERTANTNTNKAVAPIIAFGQCATKVLQTPLKRGRGRPRKSLDSIMAAGLASSLKVGARAKTAILGKATISGKSAISSKAVISSKTVVSGKAAIAGKTAISSKAVISGKTAISGKPAISGKTAISAKTAAPAKVGSAEVTISVKPSASAEKSVPAKNTLPKRPRGRPRKSVPPDGATMTQLKVSRNATDDVSDVARLVSADVHLHRVSSGKVAKKLKMKNKTKLPIPELNLIDDPRRSGRHRKLTYKFLERGLLRRFREGI